MARGDGGSRGGRRASPPPPPPRRRRSRSRSPRSRSPPKRSRRGGGDDRRTDDRSRSSTPPGRGGGRGDRAYGGASEVEIAVAAADAWAGLADRAAGVPADLAAPVPSSSRVLRTVEMLLDVKRGSWAAARLAARLLPPLIARVPSQLEPAVSHLIRLADGRLDALWPPPSAPDLPGPVKPLAEAASADAVASLGALVSVAGLDLPPADPAVQRAVAYLLKRWASDPQQGGGEEGATQPSSQPAGASQPEEGEAREVPADARGALTVAFRGNPRAVLRGIGAAAGAGRPAEAAAAEAATRGVLLKADPDWCTPSDAATDAAADAAAGLNPDAARRLGAGVAPDAPPCLAATVLGADRAARAWLEGEVRGSDRDRDRRDGPGPGRAGTRLLRQIEAALPPLAQALAAATGGGEAAAGAPGAQPPPSGPGPCLLASPPTLRLAPLPPAATPADITSACSRYAHPRSVRLVEGGAAAEVEFGDAGDAALAFQGLAGVAPPPWWGRAGGKGVPPAVDARFVADPRPGAAATTAPAFVWAPGVGSAAALERALSALAGAGLPAHPDADTRRVGGERPCIVLRFPDAHTARTAVGALAAAGEAAAAGLATGGGGTATQPSAGGGGSQPSLASHHHLALPADDDHLLLDDDAAGDGLAPSLPPGTWAGVLAKAGLPVCDGVECLDAPDAAATPGSAASCEPVAWPPALDVSLRVDVAFVLQAVLDAAPPLQLTVRRLALSPTAPRAARAEFIGFLNALASRRRAGVVELAAVGSGRYGGGTSSAPPRRLYLVPPSNSVAARLGVSWEPQESLFVVVAPPGAGGG